MDELDVMRVKTYATSGIGAWRTVFQVSTNGKAYCCQLTANLMVAACVEIYFYELSVVPDFLYRSIKTCALGSRDFVKVSIGFVLSLIAREEMYKICGSS